MINAADLPRDPLVQACLDIARLEVENDNKNCVDEIAQKKKELVALCAQYSKDEKFLGETSKVTQQNVATYLLNATASPEEVKTIIDVVSTVARGAHEATRLIYTGAVVAYSTYAVYHENKKKLAQQQAQEAAASAAAAAALAAATAVVPTAVAPSSPLPPVPSTPHPSSINGTTHTSEDRSAESYKSDSASETSFSSASSVGANVAAEAFERQRKEKAEQKKLQISNWRQKDAEERRVERETQASERQAWIVPKGAAWGAIGGVVLTLISLIIILETEGHHAAAFVWEDMLNGNNVKNGHITEAHAIGGTLMVLAGLGIGAGIVALGAKISKLPFETKKAMLKGAAYSSAISLTCLGLILLTGYQGGDHHFHDGLKGMADSIWSLLGHGHYIGEHDHTAKHTKEGFSIFGAFLTVGSVMVGMSAGAKKTPKKEMQPLAG